MKPFLAVAVLWAGATLAAPAAAQDAAVASPNARQGGRDVYTAWGHDFQLFAGTEGPGNLTTGARTCIADTCGWAAGLHIPNGAKIQSVEFSACDGDATQELRFAFLQTPKVPGSPTLLVDFTGTGVAATPGCTTFTATLATQPTVLNSKYAYVFIVNATAGTDIEWNQYRAAYKLP
jgi:hypothetical protein